MQDTAVRTAPRRGLVLAGLAVALVAVNLRAAVASVGPVLPEVRADLRLSGTATAVLTMLPVLCFGALAPAAPRLARRLGIEPVLLGAMLVLTVGLACRVLAGPALLFTVTIAIGGAIAVSNVLLPPLIKRDYGEHTGLMMGVYTMAVSGSAAIAAGLTVPLGDAIDHGWRGALGIWAVPAAVAMLVWLPRLGRRAANAGPPVSTTPDASLLRSPLAWQVTVFFGTQSLVFYAVLAWLPSIYRDLGYSPAAAGLLLSVSGLVQIPVTLVLPGLATRAPNQVGHLVGATVVVATGLVGILVAPTAAPYLWATLFGIGSGGCFALALALFVLRADQVRDTARLSAMAQTIGYLISACGPLLFGLVHELTGSWSAPLVLLLALLVPQLWCAVPAGRARWVRGSREPR